MQLSIKMRSIIFVAICCSISSVNLWAQEQTVEKTTASFIDPEMSKIEQSQFELTDEEISKADRLRVLDRSFGVSNLSAVELLGKYAKTDAERLKYARKHVLAMADNVGRSQAWGMAVYEATQETNLLQDILASNPIIESGLERMRMTVPTRSHSDFDYIPPVRTEPGRTLMMTVDCGGKCDEAFVEQYRLVLESKIDHLDVVFVGSDNEDTEAIFGWAKSMAISKETLESGSVNLHIDNEAWVEMRNGRQSVPRVIRQ